MRNPILRMAAWAAAILPPGLLRGLYRSGPASRFLRGLLNRSVPSGVVVIEVAAGLLRGAHFLLDLQREKDLWLGTYERPLQEYLRLKLEPGCVFFDVGANIGYWTVGAARAVGRAGEVHAFEPLPANSARLAQAVTMNGLDSNVRVNTVAVGEMAGRGTLLVHASHAMGKLEGSLGRADEPYGRSLEVAIVSLDGYVFADGNRPPDLVKIDVEGGEVKVLQGMRRILREAEPGLVIEVHGPEAGQGLFEFLHERGYVLAELGHPGRSLAGAGEIPWKAHVIAIPGPDRGMGP